MADNVVPVGHQNAWNNADLWTIYTPIGTCASGVTENSLTMYFAGTPALLKCPNIWFVVVLSGLSDAATCTAWYSDWSLRTDLILAVTWQFSNYPRHLSFACHNKKNYIMHTCRTVTGNLTPWSSHIAVTPRLRAIRPVRTEVGVHFAVEAATKGLPVGFLITAVCACRMYFEGGRWLRAQCLSMTRTQGTGSLTERCRIISWQAPESPVEMIGLLNVKYNL